MQDLIDQLKEQAGLTNEQAQKSVETITAYIKAKLPPMMHPMIDSFLGAASAGDKEVDILG